ncbi:MAG: hypothetical protein U1D31_02890 [Patescibacteria group bacterium]|nr:hypothetical protein [bacterium]MDZ4241039.1 hypothetical protein [Patescibacteria group bacterium]
MVTTTLPIIKEPGTLATEAVAKFRKNKNAGIPITLESAVNFVLLLNQGQTISDPYNELSKTVLTLAYRQCNGNRHRRKEQQMRLDLQKTSPFLPPPRQWFPYAND